MDRKQLRHEKGPDFTKYFVPIVEVLQDLGGSGNPGEVTDLIIERYKISDEELELRNKSGGSTVRNRIAWARFYLVKGGVLDSSKRGVWTLKPHHAAVFDKANPYSFFLKTQQLFEKEESRPSVATTTTISAEVEEKPTTRATAAR